MREIRKPDLIVFDLDDTLYDYEKANQLASNQLHLLMSAQLGCEQDEIVVAYSQARLNVKQRLGNTASSHSRLLYISETLRLLGVRPDSVSLIEYEDSYWLTFIDGIELFPNVIDIIEAIKVRKISLALVTDLTSRIQYLKLSKLGINDKFDLIITSEEAGGDKSSGLPFGLLKQFTKAPPSHSWYFGDSNFDYPKSEAKELTFFKKVKKVDEQKKSHVIQFEDYLSLTEFIKYL